MAEIQFAKMHGAGNDFIVLTEDQFKTIEQKEQIIFLCHRRAGVGSDGLIVLKEHSSLDFEMLFFNPDGSSGMLCGNGARCAVARAYALSLISEITAFMAADGKHSAQVYTPDDIEISMQDVKEIEACLQGYYLHTGAPHYVELVEHLNMFDVLKRGAEIRYHQRFQPQGTNANFIEKREDGIAIRTYERGVEKETLACGTGITAAALVFDKLQGSGSENANVRVFATGGELNISAQKTNEGYQNITMRGPAVHVFEGSIELPADPFVDFPFLNTARGN